MDATDGSATVQKNIGTFVGATTFFREGIFVPQGSMIRVRGMTGPVKVRLHIQFLNNARDLAKVLEAICCIERPIVPPSDAVCCFVYRPGEPNPQGNVFADFATLALILAALDGPKTVQIDDSLVSPVPIPSGAFDLNDSTLTAFGPGSGPGGSVLVDIADGCTLANVVEITGELLMRSLSSSPVILLGDDDTLRVSTNAALASGPGAAPLVDVSTPSADATLELFGGRLRFLGAPPVGVSGASGTLGIAVKAGGRVNSNTLLNIAGTTITVGMDNDSVEGPSQTQRVSRTQTNIAGTIAYRYIDPNETPFRTGIAAPTVGWHVMTGNVTIPLATLQAGPIYLVNTTNTTRTVSPSGGDTINGSTAPLSIEPGSSVALKSDGASAWQAYFLRGPAVGNMAFTGNLGGVNTVIPAAGTFVPIGNGAPAHPLFVANPNNLLFTLLGATTAAQVLRYDGVEPVRLCIRGSISVQDPLFTAEGFALRLLQNGAPIPNASMDGQTGGLITSAGNIYVEALVTAANLDLFTMQLANLTSAQNLNVSSAVFTVGAAA